MSKSMKIKKSELVNVMTSGSGPADKFWSHQFFCDNFLIFQAKVLKQTVSNSKFKIALDFMN